MMNTKIRKYFITIIIVLIIIVITTLSLYLFKFNGDLSSEHSFWGDFGSYFGGIVGPLATILTLLWLLIININQWQQSIAQFEKVEHERMINNFELHLRSITEKLQSLIKIKLKPNNYYLLIEQLKQDGSPIQNYQQKETEIIINLEDDKIVVLSEEDVFSLLNFVQKYYNNKVAKKYIFDENIVGQKHIILGFLGQMSYLLGYLTRLRNRGYDQFSIKYILSLYDVYYRQLYEVGLVEQLHYRYFMVLRDLPFVEEKLKTRIHPEVYLTILNKDDKYKNLNLNDIKLVLNYINKETFETKYVFHIDSTNEYFVWESTKLNKINKDIFNKLSDTNLNV